MHKIHNNSIQDQKQLCASNQTLRRTVLDNTSRQKPKFKLLLHGLMFLNHPLEQAQDTSLLVQPFTAAVHLVAIIMVSLRVAPPAAHAIDSIGLSRIHS